jgi:peptide/nickel transport system substrate-binding protein
MDSVEVTSQDPQVVVYKVNPKAAWSDGNPIDCDDFYLAWLSGNGKGGNRLDDAGKELKDDNGNPIPNFDAASVTGTEDISELECSADGKTITTTYSKQFVDYQSLFAFLIPAHIVERESGVPDVTTATDPADLQKLGVFWSEGFDGFNPDLDLSGSWYSIDQFTPGETLILSRNDKYWGTPGNLDQIIFRLIPSSEDQPAALANGDVQVIVPQPNPDLLTQVQGLDGVTAKVEGGVTFEHLDFNQANPILADVNVRKAIAMCVDRNDIVDTLIKPLAPDATVLNNRMYIPSRSAYADNGKGYEAPDIDGAKALLEKSGWALGSDGIYAKDGQRLSLRVGRRDPNPRRESIVELIAASCKNAGIELTDDGSEDFNSVRLPASDYDMALFAWVATPFQSSNASIYGPGGAQNWNNYDNADLGKLFDEANVEFDTAKRADLMNQIDTVLWNDMVSLPLFQFPNLVAYSDALTGVVYNDPLGVSWNANEWAISE